jgi:hypothetical protein
MILKRSQTVENAHENVENVQGMFTTLMERSETMIGYNAERLGTFVLERSNVLYFKNSKVKITSKNGL